MLKTSSNANPNYLCKLFKLEEVQKHPNADSLYIVEVDYVPVITSNPSVGSWYLYFPTDSKINEGFLSFTNSFRKAEKNKDGVTGFFEDNCRVKTVKLRGEYSSGFIVPAKRLEEYLKIKLPKVETYFDTVEDTLLVEKYFTSPPVVKKVNKEAVKHNIVEGEFQFHVDTDNLRKEISKLYPQDMINISYKTHGTSHILAHVLHNKKLPWYKAWYYKLFKKPTTYYDYVTSSRKVIKTPESGSYYGEDVWLVASEKFKDKVPKGYSIYSEVIGYTPSGKYIQKDYDYGCKEGEFKIMPYRIRVDGRELSPEEIIEWTKEAGLEPMVSYFTGTMQEHYVSLLGEDTVYKLYMDAKQEDYHEALEMFKDNYLKALEKMYNEKPCFMCKNKVPEEGIVIRKLNDPHRFTAFKLKSKAFLLKESMQDVQADV